MALRSLILALLVFNAWLVLFKDSFGENSGARVQASDVAAHKREVSGVISGGRTSKSDGKICMGPFNVGDDLSEIRETLARLHPDVVVSTHDAVGGKTWAIVSRGVGRAEAEKMMWKAKRVGFPDSVVVVGYEDGRWMVMADVADSESMGRERLSRARAAGLDWAMLRESAPTKRVTLSVSPWNDDWGVARERISTWVRGHGGRVYDCKEEER